MSSKSLISKFHSLRSHFQLPSKFERELNLARGRRRCYQVPNRWVRRAGGVERAGVGVIG